MPPLHGRLHGPLLDTLRRHVGPAHVLTGDEARAAARDWRGRYQGEPLALVRPGSTAEVAAVVQACAAAQPPVAVVPQGGNTGLVGGASPDASGHQVLLSLRRLQQVRAVDPDNLTLTVEAGCTLAAVQAAAAAAGLLFPLSLAAEGTATIGGNLASNAGGTQVLRYGNARELCLGLEVVLADGRVWPGLQGLRKDNTGYALRDLFIGSEGTLGIITAATLKLFPQPRAVLSAWVACPGLPAATALLRGLRAAFDAELTAFEAMALPALHLVARHQPALQAPLALDGLPPGSWCVLVELSSPHPEGLIRGRLDEALAEALHAGLLLDAALATSGAQAALMWQWREAIPLAQSREGLNIKHDIALPVSAIPGFVAAADAALDAGWPGCRHISFGHLGDGNLHYNLQAPAGEDAAAFLAQHEHAVNARVYDLVQQHGGTFSAEHGIGQLKRDELRLRKAAVHLDLLQALKGALDPAGLLNPGKML